MKVPKTNFKYFFPLIYFFKNFLLFKLIKPIVFTVAPKKLLVLRTFGNSKFIDCSYRRGFHLC